MVLIHYAGNIPIVGSFNDECRLAATHPDTA
jgi:hypothetical protein